MIIFRSKNHVPSSCCSPPSCLGQKAGPSLYSMPSRYSESLYLSMAQCLLHDKTDFLSLMLTKLKDGLGLVQCKLTA
jgi:hypothetical protein